jgi:site-specific recombinase XerD
LRTGEQISVCSISTLVSCGMSRAGVEESAHALRHTIATLLARERGRDLTLVADIPFGHADLMTARHYARPDRKDRRAAVEALAE